MDEERVFIKLTSDCNLAMRLSDTFRKGIVRSPTYQKYHPMDAVGRAIDRSNRGSKHAGLVITGNRKLGDPLLYIAAEQRQFG